MAILSDHLAERSGKKNYQLVGEVTRTLFPNAFAQHVKKIVVPIKGATVSRDHYDDLANVLEEKVRDRVRKFSGNRAKIDAAVRGELAAKATSWKYELMLITIELDESLRNLPL